MSYHAHSTRQCVRSLPSLSRRRKASKEHQAIRTELRDMPLAIASRSGHWAASRLAARSCPEHRRSAHEWTEGSESRQGKGIARQAHGRCRDEERRPGAERDWKAPKRALKTQSTAQGVLPRLSQTNVEGVDFPPACSEQSLARSLLVDRKTEREGFEPSIRVTPDTAFPVRRPRPTRRSLRTRV